MSQNVYDQASRFAAKLDPPGFLAWLLNFPPPGLTFGGWLDTRSVPFPAGSDSIGDTVARLEDPATHGTPWAVAVEFQVQPDPLMFGRLLAYLSNLWMGLKPDAERGSRFNIGAAVVNLTGTGRASRRMEWPATGLITHLGVVERNLASESADELLNRIETGTGVRSLLAWVPLMQGADAPACAEQWKRLAELEPDRRQRSEYAGLALVFAEAADRFDFWDDQLRGWNVTESKVVNRWIAQGEVKGRKEGRTEGLVTATLDLLADKAITLPSEVEAMIRATTDEDRLRRWHSAAARAATLDEFRALTGL